MATATQQKAKSMAQQHIQGQDTNAQEMKGFFNFLGDTLERQRQYNADMYDRQTTDARQTAERSATLQGEQNLQERQTRQNIAATQAAGQMGAAANANYGDMVKWGTWLADNPQAKRQEDAFNAKADALADKAFGNNKTISYGGSGGGGGGVGGGSAFGKYAGVDFHHLGDNGAVYGHPSESFNSRRVRDYEFNRNLASRTTRDMSEAEAAGDILRANAQIQGQKDILQAQSRYDIDSMNRRASIDAQSNANQRLFQSAETEKDRANQRYLGQLQARTSMYNSMLDIYNPARTNFAYWG